MLPHPDTMYSIHALDYRLRPRHAAKERLADSAHSGGRRRGGAVWIGGAAWFGGVLSRLRAVGQARVPGPLTAGSAQPAHRAS